MLAIPLPPPPIVEPFSPRGFNTFAAIGSQVARPHYVFLSQLAGRYSYDDDDDDYFFYYYYYNYYYSYYYYYYYSYYDYYYYFYYY